MEAQDAELTRFLKAEGWGAATQSALAGDASGRRYVRLQKPKGARAILMLTPRAEIASQRAFLRVAGFLTKIGLAPPEVYAVSDPPGALILEDLGDDLFARIIPGTSEVALYEAAVDVILHLAACEVPDWAEPLVPRMAGDLEPFFTWYLDAPGEAGPITQAMNAALAGLPAQPQALSLRDYHAENLIWRPEATRLKRVGLLDFQDACAAPAVYDLVSLLDDARRDVGAAARRAAVARFQAATGLGAEALDLSMATLGLARNLRILGVLTRLGRAGGKPGYLRLLPRVRGHVDRALQHAGVRDLRDLLAPHLRQAVAP